MIIGVQVYMFIGIKNSKFDNNNDGFLDLPVTDQINLMNRWQYTNLERDGSAFELEVYE